MVKKYGTFEAGIPKHDTIARVSCRLKSDEIEKAFQSWISGVFQDSCRLNC
ncbi:transposase family protein [Shewanella psychromarinicola]|uniref:transposase family protein n=1 Tax=Shewanella psychromarinicola TaxID=2487742 RepID=UPI003558A2A1